jgi:hypothetical protein
MTRVQILITEEQDGKLEALAHALRTSKARLVREGVDIVLRRTILGRSDPLLELVGRAGALGVPTSRPRYFVTQELRMVVAAPALPLVAATEPAVAESRRAPRGVARRATPARGY